MTTHAIAKLYHYTKHLNLCMMQCNACCKCENDSRCSHSYLETTVHNQGLICIVSDVGVPELVSAFRIIKGPISGVRANAFPIRGIQDLR